MSTIISDPFDLLLKHSADILVRNASGEDKRGMADPTFTSVFTGWPCRDTTGKSIKRGREWFAQSKKAIIYHEVFMRPWYVDQSPDGSFQPNYVFGATTYNTQPLLHEHWLALNGEKHDIWEIDKVWNQDGSMHHLEVWTQVVQP